MLAETPGSLALLEPDNPKANPDASASYERYGRVPVFRDGDRAPEYERLWDAAFNGRWSHLPADRQPRMETGNAPTRTSVFSMIQRRASAQPRNLIVKSVFAAFAMEWLIARYRPRVILIERHPLNVIAGWMELGMHMAGLGYRDDVRLEYIERYRLPAWNENAPRLLQVAWAVGLMMHVMRVQARAHPDWHIVSHEALCVDPRSGFAALARSVGLSWSAKADASLRESNAPGTGYQTKRLAAQLPEKWRSLPASDVRAAVDVLAQFPEMAPWLGAPELSETH